MKGLNDKKGLNGKMKEIKDCGRTAGPWMRKMFGIIVTESCWILALRKKCETEIKTRIAMALKQREELLSKNLKTKKRIIIKDIIIVHGSLCS